MCGGGGRRRDRGAYHINVGHEGGSIGTLRTGETDLSKLHWLENIVLVLGAAEARQ